MIRKQGFLTNTEFTRHGYKNLQTQNESDTKNERIKLKHNNIVWYELNIIKSDLWFSKIWPVQDLVETRSEEINIQSL